MPVQPHEHPYEPPIGEPEPILDAIARWKRSSAEWYARLSDEDRALYDKLRMMF